ncbi:MAG: hypothetical protein V1929_11430 [bacterium]
MRLGVKQFFAIAGLTALEAVRQPIVLLLSTFTVVFIGLLPFFVIFTIGDTERLVRDSALSIQFVVGLVLGGYAACATLTHEIRRGTVGSVLSKPVNRVVFFLAKYAGIAIVTILFSTVAAVATLLSTRASAGDYVLDWWAAGPLLAAAPVAFAIAAFQNFFLRRLFVSRAFGLLVLACLAALAIATFVGPDGTYGPPADHLAWPILRASILIAMAVLVLAAIAVSLATRLDAAPTVTICGFVFIAGLMSDYLFGRHAGVSAWANAAYHVVPNWQHFWVVDALSRNGIPWSYVAQAGAYAALYLAGVLCLGIVAFRRMEVRG